MSPLGHVVRALLRMAAAIIVLALPAAAWARDLTVDETTAITAMIDDFNAAMAGGNLDGLTDSLPPPIVAQIASNSGISIEDLRAAMKAQVAAAMASVTFESFEMDIAKAEHRELADGTPYLVIPTFTIINDGTRKLRGQSPTLVFSDGGMWYLMRIGDGQQSAMLARVYPQFADVQFPPSTSEPVQE